MRPCLVFYQLLLFFLLGGQTNEDHPESSENSHDKTEDQAVENENHFQVEFNPSSMLAFVPARRCHVQLSGDFGTFSPPVSYGNMNVNLWCNWTILAAPGKHIVIYITGFRTNAGCNQNNDEIIFEGVSSSVENDIVYACWNKHTHVFAAQALAVNVVLLWRSFSHIGSNKYFEGRYYVFDDPTFSVDPRNSSLATSKQNKSTSDILTKSPEERPRDTSPLYSSVLTKSSFSNIFNISKDETSGFQENREQNSIIEAHRPTLKVDEMLTLFTHESDLLKDVPSAVVHSFSLAYNTSEELWPVAPHSLEAGEHKDHTDIWTAEDLEPSHVGKWETKSQSIWISKKASSQLLPETPNLTIAHYTELPEMLNFSITHATGIPETILFSKDPTIPGTPNHTMSHAVESPHVNTAHIIVPHETEHLGTAHTIHVTKTLHVHKAYATELTEVPYFSVAHTIELPESPLFSIARTTELSEIPYFSVAHPSDLTELPEIPGFSVTHSVQRTEMPHFSKVHHIDYMEIPNLNVAHITEILHVSATDGTDLPEIPHFSIGHAIQPTLKKDLKTAESSSAQIKTLLTKIPLSDYTESLLEKTVSTHPWGWQVTSNLPTITGTAESTKNLFTSAQSFTKTPTTSFFVHFPLQLTSSPEQPFVASYVSSLPLASLLTKSLSNGIAGQIANDPYHLEQSKAFQFVSSSTSSAALHILPSKMMSSVLGLQIHMVHSAHLSAFEQPLGGSSPQNPVFISDQQIFPEVTPASHSPPEFPNEFVFSERLTPSTEKISKLVIEIQNTSPKVREIQSLTTREYKRTESIAKVTRQIGFWAITHSADSTDTEYKIPIQPISKPVLDIFSSSRILKSIPFSATPEGKEPQGTLSQSNLRQATAKWQTSTHVDDVTTIGLITAKNKKSTYSYQTNSDLDIYENEVGHPKSNSLDDLDTIHFFENETELGLPHVPGDSLFAITTEIEHQDIILRGMEKELIESLTEKITDKIIYFPNGVNSLMLKEITWETKNRVKVTFWLYLKHGGKEMGKFLKTQLQTLESHPLGSFSATLVSFSVEDVNECQLGIQNCNDKAHCVNMVGTYSCHCMSGYEDHSPDAPGTVCSSSQPAEIHSLSEHVEILIAAITSVAATTLVVIIILCIIRLRRSAKANFNLGNRTTRQHAAHRGPLTPHPGEHGPYPSHTTTHRSPQQELYTPREMPSMIEMTIEQTAC